MDVLSLAEYSRREAARGRVPAENSMVPFRNRADAGHLLAERLAKYADRPDVTVLALPRGGVPVGYEVARALRAPLDVFVVRKLGVPGQEELALGAIASGGVQVLNDEVVRGLRIPEALIDAVAAREQRELERREQAYRGGRPAPPVRGRTGILVDDGVATGSTMMAAIQALRQLGAGRIVAAAATAARSAAQALRSAADEWVAVRTPADFGGVGQWYEDFSQTTDEDVCGLLRNARRFSDSNRT